MKKILILDTGGTISQEKNENGTLIPGVADIVKIVPRLKDIAKVEYTLIKRIDSTNMTQEIRVKIAQEIEKRHSEFDGFVITHGTDTMADTACALNYMIQDLGKPIVITGAQLPMFAPGPDGLNNLFYSVKAATDDIGEVVICFGDRIIRGNRSYKENVEGFNAFSSPRAPFIGNLGVNIRLNENRIKRYHGNPKFFTKFENGIVAINQISGSSINLLKYCLHDDSIKGVILLGYGTGNIQSIYVDSIKQITDAGKKVIIVTSCSKGPTILEQYETGFVAKEAGALPGLDLTIHAASQKMIYALGRDPNNFEKLFYERIGRDIEEPLP